MSKCQKCGRGLKAEVIEWCGPSQFKCECDRCWPDKTRLSRIVARGTIHRAHITYCEICESNKLCRVADVSRHMKIATKVEKKEGHFADIRGEGVAWADVTSEWNSVEGSIGGARCP